MADKPLPEKPVQGGGSGCCFVVVLLLIAALAASQFIPRPQPQFPAVVNPSNAASFAGTWQWRNPDDLADFQNKAPTHIEISISADGACGVALTFPNRLSNLDGSLSRTVAVRRQLDDKGVIDLGEYGTYALRVSREEKKADKLLLILTGGDGFGFLMLEFSGPIHENVPGS
jgi:hypothetical protein